MNNYEVRIDVNRLLHYSEVLKPQVNNETLIMLIKEFSEYIRDVYLDMIEDAMYSSKYKGKWEPIEEEGYIKYINTTPSVPIMDMIEDAMEIREKDYDIFIRINPRYRYKGSKMSLVRVVRAIDNGTSDFNARPIFKKIIRYLERNMLTQWRGFLRLRGKML